MAATRRSIARRGKLTMAVLGHPFYAGGYDQTAGDESLRPSSALLREHDVAIVMAGDTHDLEYYTEPRRASEHAMHYFVNGGGGAYLSFGTSLPGRPAGRPRTGPTIPTTAPCRRRSTRSTPWWKRPAWWWTRRFGAWPFSAEWLSAAFDYNVAPFFQSFVEVRVEPSANRIILRPYGVHGRLTWGDFASSEAIRPAGATRETPVEWMVPMVLR